MSNSCATNSKQYEQPKKLVEVARFNHLQSPLGKGQLAVIEAKSRVTDAKRMVPTETVMSVS